MRSSTIINSRPSLPLERTFPSIPSEYARVDFSAAARLCAIYCDTCARVSACVGIFFRKKGETMLDSAPSRQNELFIFTNSASRESEERFQQAGVKCKRRETHVRRSARARAPPPPSKRNLADTMEYRIFNTPPGNAKRGARQWLFLGTDSRSFISIRRFLYMNRYAAVAVDAKTRHLRRENRGRIHYAEVSTWRYHRWIPHVI